MVTRKRNTPEGATDGKPFGFDFASGLDRFEPKVLLVASTCSALGADFQRRHHLPLFADAELVTIEDAGHRLMVEQFDAVLAASKDYLDQYAGQR